MGSLDSYILNLNSHSAYKEMRSYRALMNKTGKYVKGYDVAIYLENYAEIGLAYVTKVTEMINNNKLDRFDYHKNLKEYYDLVTSVK